jgi:hypothetical protein
MGMTARAVTVTGKAQRGKKIRLPLLVIHNSPRIVHGGRSAVCDLQGNTNGAQERGCEVVSSVWLPYMKVMFILTYPNGARQTFVDYADHRGHALHPFNVAYLPLKQAKHRRVSNMAQIEVLAETSNGTWTKPQVLHFTITR